MYEVLVNCFAVAGLMLKCTVGHCINLWFTFNKDTVLLPTNLLHVPDRTCNIYMFVCKYEDTYCIVFNPISEWVSGCCQPARESIES